MRNIILAATLTLCACGTPMQWAGDGNVDRDNAQCRYEAEIATPLPATGGIASAIASGIHAGRLINLCMQARGYRQVVSQ